MSALGGEDTALVQRVASGEPSALEALYRRHAPRLYALLLPTLKQGAAAEEVLQESFVDVWKRAAEYRPALGALERWLIAFFGVRASPLRRGPAANACGWSASVSSRPPPWR